MAYEKVGMFTENNIKLGGINKKTGKPNPTTLEGYYKGTKEVKNEVFEGVSQIHVFKTKAGDVGVWGAANLNYQIKDCQKGVSTLIKFMGTKPSKKGSPMQVFEVLQDKSNADGSIEVTAGPLEEAEEPSHEADEPSFDDGSFDVEEIEAEPAYVAPVAPRQPARPVNSDAKSKVDALLASRKRIA